MFKKICIVGLGYVGLPNATLLANSGADVIGIDIRKNVVESVGRGEMPFVEHALTESLRNAVKSKKLKASTNIADAVDADAFIIAVQTPVENDGIARLKHLKSAAEDVARVMKRGALVIIESTIPPLTMNSISELISERSKLTPGKDFFIAYCPERLLPGTVIHELQTNSRVVGGYDARSAKLAAELYRMITRGEIATTDFITAELAKLAENTYRDVNIALSNELALISERLNGDVNKVIEISNKHPRVHLHAAGCGVGGHCLPKDPLLLLSSVQGFESKIVRHARELNDSMPEESVQHLIRKLKKSGYSLKGMKVALLGVSYKGDSDDLRTSPAEKIFKLLKAGGAEVHCTDPFVKKVEYAEIESFDEAVKGAAAAFIATDHSAYKKIDLKELAERMRPPKLVFDGRRILNEAEISGHGMSYAGVGLG